MTRHLNNWQKLWLVLSALYAIPVIVVLESEWPYGWREKDRLLPPLPAGFVIEKPKQTPEGGATRDLFEVFRIDPNVNPAPMTGEVIKLRSERIKMLAGAFAAWLIPVATVYVLGMGMARIGNKVRASGGLSYSAVRRYILGAAVLFCLLMLLFPPFHFADNGMTVNLGYASIFDPPLAGDEDWSKGLVTVPILIAQWIGVLIITGLAVLMTKSGD